MLKKNPIWAVGPPKQVNPNLKNTQNIFKDLISGNGFLAIVGCLFFFILEDFDDIN